MLSTDAFTESNQGLARLTTATLVLPTAPGAGTATVVMTVPTGARVMVTDMIFRDNNFATTSAYTATVSAYSTVASSYSAVPVAYAAPGFVPATSSTNTSGDGIVVSPTGVVSFGVDYPVAAALRVLVTGVASATAVAGVGSPILDQNSQLQVTLSTANTLSAGSAVKVDVYGIVL